MRFLATEPKIWPILGFWLFDTHGAQSGPFLAIVGPFLGHIAELEGKNGIFVTGQSRLTWKVATVSLRLSILNGFRGSFGPKKTVLGQEMCSFGRAPPDLPPPPPGATGEFLAWNLGLASAPPRL